MCLILAAGVCLGAAGSRGPALPADAERHTDVPVLLVPGWFDTERDLAALRIRLTSAGWEADHVATVSFADPTGSNRRHAEEIDSAARALMYATDHDELDVVAHSMGGLATRWMMLQPGAPSVRRVVFVASPHRGTLSAYVAWGDGSEEMKPGSAFLDTLNAAPPVPAGVEALTIRTSVDTRIIPGESATLPGVSDETLCCPSHAGLLYDFEAFRIIRRFLDQGDG
jgi:triacylglycerol lipase